MSHWPGGKAPVSRKSDPGIESRFPRSSHACDLNKNTGPIAAILPGAWCYTVSAKTGGPGTGIMEADERQVMSFHSPTVIPPSALDKPSIMKRYHRLRTCSHTSPRRSPTMLTLRDTRFVECRWWNDGWTVKTVVT